MLLGQGLRSRDFYSAASEFGLRPLQNKGVWWSSSLPPGHTCPLWSALSSQLPTAPASAQPLRETRRNRFAPPEPFFLDSLWFFWDARCSSAAVSLPSSSFSDHEGQRIQKAELDMLHRNAGLQSDPCCSFFCTKSINSSQMGKEAVGFYGENYVFI